MSADAVGVLLDDGSFSYLSGDSSGYSMRANGNFSLVGLDGLAVSGDMTVLVNTTGEAMNPDSSEDGEIPAGTFSVTVTDATFSVGDIFSIGGTLIISRSPNGDLSVLVAGGSARS